MNNQIIKKHVLDYMNERDFCCYRKEEFVEQVLDEDLEEVRAEAIDECIRIIVEDRKVKEFYNLIQKLESLKSGGQA